MILLHTYFATHGITFVLRVIILTAKQFSNSYIFSDFAEDCDRLRKILCKYFFLPQKASFELHRFYKNKITRLRLVRLDNSESFSGKKWFHHGILPRPTVSSKHKHGSTKCDLTIFRTERKPARIHLRIVLFGANCLFFCLCSLFFNF